MSVKEGGGGSLRVQMKKMQTQQLKYLWRAAMMEGGCILQLVMLLRQHYVEYAGLYGRML